MEELAKIAAGSFDLVGAVRNLAGAVSDLAVVVAALGARVEALERAAGASGTAEVAEQAKGAEAAAPARSPVLDTSPTAARGETYRPAWSSAGEVVMDAAGNEIARARKVRKGG